MAERFPKTAAGIPSAQLDFEKAKELKMRAFVADFMEEYNSAIDNGAARGSSAWDVALPALLPPADDR